MKRFVLLGMLGLYLCAFFAGCHTLDALSMVKTGRVGFDDTWQALKADDREFQRILW